MEHHVKERINNTELLRSSGLRVVHIRPAGSFYAVRGARRGMTVAYRPSNKPVIEIATSLCKNGDTFCKKVGTKTAIESFQKGRTIFVPVGKDRLIDDLKAMFGDFGY